MTDNDILNTYIPMVNFLADVCGPSFEVILHDISKPDSSVIAIRNGHITNRQIGSPLTDLALKILKKKDYTDKNYITNYEGSGGKNRFFLSSTYYIKNRSDELIGMMCVNNDITDINNFKNYFTTFNKRFEYIKDIKNTDYNENLQNPLISIANSIILKTIKSMNIPAARMSIEEKIKIVHTLNDEGVFLMKGTIPDVAKQLNISETTVYRYLNKK